MQKKNHLHTCYTRLLRFRIGSSRKTNGTLNVVERVTKKMQKKGAKIKICINVSFVSFFFSLLSFWRPCRILQSLLLRFHCWPISLFHSFLWKEQKNSLNSNCVLEFGIQLNMPFFLFSLFIFYSSCTNQSVWALFCTVFSSLMHDSTNVIYIERILCEEKELLKPLQKSALHLFEYNNKVSDMLAHP